MTTTPDTFKAYLMHVTSRGWVEYCIESIDKLDTYEDTNDVGVAEAEATSPVEAVRAVLAAAPAGFAALLKEAEEEEAADKWGGPAWVRNVLSDMATLATVEWERDQFRSSGWTGTIRTGKCSTERWEVRVYMNLDDLGWPDHCWEEDESVVAEVEAVLTEAVAA